MFKKYDPKMLMWGLISMLVGVSMVVGIPQSVIHFPDAVNELVFMYFAFLTGAGFILSSKR